MSIRPIRDLVLPVLIGRLGVIARYVRPASVYATSMSEKEVDHLGPCDAIPMELSWVFEGPGVGHCGSGGAWPLQVAPEALQRQKLEWTTPEVSKLATLSDQ